GYFLIVQDFINWAKNNAIPVGPGRGSAVGSLVAYALRITDLDPIPHNLLFERFLNSERISMPDIDVDFCEARRQQVIDYVNQKYGAQSVSQITTFGKMMAKAVVRDVGRALGMSFQETDRVAKLIPTFPQTGPKIELKHLLNEEEFAKLFANKTDEEGDNKDKQIYFDAEDLRNSYADDVQVRKLLDTAMRLEGLVRHASVHAAGLVLSDRPMTDYLPVYRGKGENDVVTQFDMKMVEKVGLVKFDFLGLRNLTVIENTRSNIKAQGKEEPDIATLPLDDLKVYQMYSRGDTDGVFQMESSGMRRYLKQLKPTVFEDLIAMVSLYRPGPMENIPEFIRRKHGREEMSYLLPELEECLKNTYGIMVYQEQVMQIARIVAGYSLGGADLLRRAMGKKDRKAMEAEQSKFVAGALALGVAEKKARDIFNLVNKFAGYGFNKSHAAAYALISYQTAWLKTHYPTEFMAALLSSEMNDHDKLLKYAATCKDMGVDILPPDVNGSSWDFTVRDEKVLYGLGGIKNVGEEAVREMVDERKNNGPFVSLFDLCCRLSTRKMNKRALESLIKGGACDTFGVSRAALAAALDETVSKAQKKNKNKQNGRISMLSMLPETASEPGIGYACPENSIEEWDNADMSRFEKEALGFYFTSHPLQPFRRDMDRLGLTPLEECRDMKPNTPFACAVLAKIDKVRTDSQDRRWAILQVEDLTAKATALCYSSVYEKFKDLLLPDTPLYMEGRINRPNSFDKDENPEGDDDAQKEISIRVEKVSLLSDACRQNRNPYCLEISQAEVTPDRLADLNRIISRHKGPVPMHLLLDLGEFWCRLGLDKEHGIDPGPPFYQDIKIWEEAGA
ncbi:MAG: DNA polymerase III subunit alpha, partial [Desulfovibrio sp.]|nr:DNA polymerase III subunit alpha [Desulfovibrio sp.]